MGSFDHVSLLFLPYTYTHTHIHMYTMCRLTGYSPFQGETHSDTFCNVSMCEYDFEDEVFDEVSQEAKDFIEELLQKKPRYVYTCTCIGI